MVNVLSFPDDLLGRLAYPEGWHDFQWWITLRLGFQAPEMGWTGPVERGVGTGLSGFDMRNSGSYVLNPYTLLNNSERRC